jgi:hypothetical protein
MTQTSSQSLHGTVQHAMSLGPPSHSPASTVTLPGEEQSEVKSLDSKVMSPHELPSAGIVPVATTSPPMDTVSVCSSAPIDSEIFRQTGPSPQLMFSQSE